MRSGGQLSLIGGAGMGHLFRAEVLKRYLHEHSTTPIVSIDENAKRIASWLGSLSVTTAGESSLETAFTNDILCGVLGYSIYPPQPGDIASLYQKPSSQVTRIPRTPDAMLGEFHENGLQFTAAVELKTPGTDLDAPQPRVNSETPVEQGFYYGRRILGTRWVLVSDMRRIRLYSVESDGEYEEIRLDDCVKSGQPTEMYRRLHFLFHHQYLIAERENSQVALLYEKSAAQRLEVRDSFYQAYYDIRTDLYQAVRKAAADLDHPDRQQLLGATQRLLDRLVFLYFCEDHPQQLIPRTTVQKVCDAARLMPGTSGSKVYRALKDLFREVDAGSPAGNKIRIFGYNGELFKDHPIVDRIDLPDALHDKQYLVSDGKRGQRRVSGVWGLHEYDFWSELNEHLLGHIFEQSLSDMGAVGTKGERTAAERLRERKKHGIFYTSSILSDFLADSAIEALLDESAPIGDSGDLDQSLGGRLSALHDLRIIDLACGSGAFLVSAYHALLREYWRVRLSTEKVANPAGGPAPDLFQAAAAADQASLLRQCLYGADILPQAVEIAKLALWLSSARNGEKVADLGANLVAADSLRIDCVLEALSLECGTVDLVIGNPPWGGEVTPEAYRLAAESLGIPSDERLDTWELFLLLGIHVLREGGRLSLVIPDSFFYSEKQRTRQRLLSMATVEKLHYLGPDWFGNQVRMGTVVIQARKGSPDRNTDIFCSVLAGDLRRQAIRGKIPLTQLESQMGHQVPMARVLDSETAEFQVFRGKEDDRIMERMVASSIAMGDLCERGRGEEVNKSGTLWVCPGCLAITTPGAKAKGGGYNEKACPTCGHILTAQNVQAARLTADLTGTPSSLLPYIDGDDINRRYQTVTPTKGLRTDVTGWAYKPCGLYASPKILIRQAGVGIVATLDLTNARCPQSVYVYRLLEEHASAGYAHEYVLAALLSRTMTYYVFKQFGEIDPAKAHSKLTHDRLQSLPIPRLDFADQRHRDIQAAIVADVRLLLAGTAALGGEEDGRVELQLRRLWGIAAVEGAYVNSQFYGLDNSQVVRDLFPAGPPKPQEIPPPVENHV